MLLFLLLFVPGVVSSDEHLWLFRPRPRDRRPRPRRKEEEVKEEPKARLEFFVSPLPDLPEDICTDANDDERFLHGERRRTEGILFRRRLNRRRLGWICLFLFLLLASARVRVSVMTNVFKNLPKKREKELF